MPPVGRVSALDDYFGTCVTAKASDEAENKKSSSGNPSPAFGQRGDSGGSSNRLTQKSPASVSPAASPTTGKQRRKRSPEISIQIAEEDTKIVTTAAMTSDSKEDGEDTSACINVLNYNENFRSATANLESPSATPNFKPFYSNRNIKSDSHIIGRGVSVDEVEGKATPGDNQLIRSNKDSKLTQMMDDSMDLQSDFSFLSTSEKPKQFSDNNSYVQVDNFDPRLQAEMKKR